MYEWSGQGTPGMSLGKPRGRGLGRDGGSQGLPIPQHPMADQTEAGGLRGPTGVLKPFSLG